MRFFPTVLFLLAMVAGGHAQFHLYPESEAVQRWDSSTKKAIAAVNEYAESKPGKKKKKKPDPSLANPLGSKTFEGGGGLNVKKEVQENAFLYDEKVSEKKFRGSRKFLGIKNPWFGEKIYDAKDASLWSKSVVPNADREFSAGEVETRSARQSEKALETDTEVVPVRPYPGRGGAQGAMDKITDSMKKEMSIEEVRELLNKNR